MPGPRRWLRPTGCTRRCPAVSRPKPAAGSRRVDSSRPKLVLLRPTEDAAAADVDGGDGSHYERVGVLDRPEPACLPEVSVALPVVCAASRRDGAAPRCCAAWVVWRSRPRSSACSPGMHLAWVFTGLTGAGRARPRRSDGLRQGARGRTGTVAVPGASRRHAAQLPVEPGDRPATPAPGTTTTFEVPRAGAAEAARRPPAERPDGRPLRRGSRSPTILGSAGGVAQLAERYVRIVEVGGSSPLTSTTRRSSSTD